MAEHSRRPGNDVGNRPTRYRHDEAGENGQEKRISQAGEERAPNARAFATGLVVEDREEDRNHHHDLEKQDGGGGGGVVRDRQKQGDAEVSDVRIGGGEGADSEFRAADVEEVASNDAVETGNEGRGKNICQRAAAKEHTRVGFSNRHEEERRQGGIEGDLRQGAIYPRLHHFYSGKQVARENTENNDPEG